MEELPEWSYLSDTRGVGGSIKEQIEDFVVEEVADHDIGSGDFLIFRLTKRNMTTMDALQELSDILHVSRKRFGYAGNKDKRAVTTQYISVDDMDEDDFKTVFMPNLEIDVMGKGERIGLGNLSHNKFDVIIRDINLPEDTVEDRIDSIWEELDGYIPNYFGSQRFGSVRPITHQVGKKMLEGDFEEAVWIYIAKPYEEEYEQVKKVRKDLWDSRDPERGAEKFPEQYKYEKILLYHLANQPGDYKGAIKRLPEGLQKLFIHAFQSFVFNKALSYLIDEGFGDKDAELPLVGYKTPLKEDKGGKKVKEVLEEEGISQEDFKLREMKHLRSEGDYRKCFAPVEDFEIVDIGSDDLNINKNMVEASFNLGKGTYATVLLREFMKA
ncbi:MAG: tRNA pseudouridine(13) synthase TruD [Candidatus Nanohaloarchaea archaeon]|nr:tRNA pseudouridine(13) synthase TruD [Candidatus Nanohaloarchaea archaeon]